MLKQIVIPLLTSSGGANFMWLAVSLGLIALMALTVIVPRVLLKRVRRSDRGILGFAYDEEQDIFYSVIDAWQREFGYCRLYDEAAPPLDMILDCEPLRFEFAGARWLIELWKGQYGALTGCEVGVYSTRGPDLSVPGVFDGTFYGDTETLLEMSFVLKKNGVPLFSRRAVHWWLTGFRLGEFSDPGQLTADIRIRFRAPEMQEAFVEALRDLGYTKQEYAVYGDLVYIIFSSPHTKQPVTRTAFEKIAQKNNRRLCDAVSAIAGETRGPEKIKRIAKQDSALHDRIQSSARGEALYDGFPKLFKN